MSSLFERINKELREACFCYKPKDGQGFINKAECECFQAKQKICGAWHQQEAFHKRYGELDAQGYTRRQILEIFEQENAGQLHLWYDNNVKK